MDEEVYYDITSKDYIVNNYTLDETASNRLESDVIYRVKKDQLVSLLLPVQSIAVVSISNELEGGFFTVNYTLHFKEKDGEILPIVKFSESNDLPFYLKAADVKAVYECHDVSPVDIAKSFTTSLLIDKSIYDHPYIINNVIEPAKKIYKEKCSGKIIMLDSCIEESKKVYVFSHDHRLMEEANNYSIVLGGTDKHGVNNKDKRFLVLKGVKNSVLNTDKYKDKTYKFVIINEEERAMEFCGTISVESLYDVNRHEYKLLSVGLSEYQDMEYINDIIEHGIEKDVQNNILSGMFKNTSVKQTKVNDVSHDSIDDDFLSSMW